MIKTTGWLIVSCLLVSSLTGLILAWFFVPSTAEAYRSVQQLESAVLLGPLLRALHFYSSHFALALTVIHWVSSLVQRDPDPSTSNRWRSGLLALLLLMVLAFSGKILPWDLHGGVSFVLARSFLRENTLDPMTTFFDPEPYRLGRLCLVHGLFTVLLLFTLQIHLGLRWSWEKPVQLWRSARTMAPLMLVLGLIVLISLVRPAPLGRPFDLMVQQAHVSAEWYLRWLQWLSLQSILLARVLCLALFILGLLTPLLISKISMRTSRVIWATVLVILIMLSVLPEP